MAQTRYRTLLSHLAQVFQAGDGERTSRLQAGLDDIVAKIDPQDAKTWQLVKADSERLLRVWAMREERALMEQILGALSDYATAEKEELPTLVISALPVPATAALAVAAPAPTPISTHVEESKDSKVDDDSADEAIEAIAATEDGSVVEPNEEAEAEAEAEAEEEDDATAATEEDGSVVEAEEAEDGSVVEPDEEVEEEEDAADEEEGMEVDKVVIRGRSYWMDTKTKKLYAVVGDDDVGDEVGAIVNGKALFIG